MKVLIAEDDITSCQILEVMLKKWGHEVVVCSDGDQAWAVLQEDDAPRMAILDWVMPGLDGTEICQLVRKAEEGGNGERYQYIILLTGKTGHENLVAGMEAGADDYIAKPFANSELLARLRAGQRIIELQAEIVEAKEELRRQSMTDSLTGILNRRAITQCAKDEMARSVRHDSSLTMAVLDIDFFKKVNDTYGHVAGDAVLKDCANCMEENIRTYDQLGRFGGEEFLIVFPGTDGAEAFSISERVRQEIEEHTSFHEGDSIKVTVSIGVAEWDRFADLDQWIALADASLYKAKESTRNLVILT